MDKISNKQFNESKLIPGVIRDEEIIKNAIGYNLNIKTVNNENLIPILFLDKSWGYAPIGIVNDIIENINDIEEELIPFTKAAKMIGVTKYTLERWYRWYRNRKDIELDDKIPCLPAPVTVKKVKHFYKHQIAELKKFAQFYKSNWGMMRREYTKNNNKRRKEYGFNKRFNN